MELLNKYFNIQKEIFDYFGYKEDWKVIPLSNDTNYYWSLLDHSVRFCEAKNIEQAITILADEQDGYYYEHQIYTQRFLPKWVYRTDDYTMISVDTYTDDNKFLSIFDNKKEIPLNVLMEQIRLNENKYNRSEN